jgi:hypothetical protein
MLAIMKIAQAASKARERDKSFVAVHYEDGQVARRDGTR